MYRGGYNRGGVVYRGGGYGRGVVYRGGYRGGWGRGGNAAVVGGLVGLGVGAAIAGGGPYYGGYGYRRPYYGYGYRRPYYGYGYGYGRRWRY